ncbi:MAG: chromate efflux transporter [Thermodesulfovibrionales bacterium]|nr:chromate efflux transporter [Thermodesulfovibrionales bacterium]
MFLIFLRLGAISFGGPAMVEYLRATLINSKKWIDNDTFTKGLVTCQTIPGAIVVNLTSYCGYHLKGLSGMIVAFTSFLIPSFSLMLLFSYFYVSSQDLILIKAIFQGLEVIVVAIVINAALRFGKERLKKDIRAITLSIISAGLLLYKVNPLFVIALMALIGIIGSSRYNLSVKNVNSKKPTKKEIIILAAILTVFYITIYFIGNDLLILSLTMTKIALMSFGGVYTALPLMYHETVESLKWMSSKTFMDGIALGQVTPGPILINAVFVGFAKCGFAGAFAGAMAIFGPGPLLITIMMQFISKVESSKYFKGATMGMISAFAGLLIFIAIKFFLAVHWDVLKVIILSLSLIWLLIKNNVLALAIVGAILSAIIF